MRRSSVGTLALVAALAASATACKSRSRSSTSPTTTAVSVAVVIVDAAAPPTLPPLTATSPSIALGNLDAQIDSAEKQGPTARGLLVELLLSRGQYVGRIADYERASSIAVAWAKEKPDDPASLETRASTESTFHRFDAALADLDEAEKHGEKPQNLAAARASIFAATGRYDDAAALMPSNETLMRPLDFARKGFLAGDIGNETEAKRLLTLARDKYVDVSPFPLAWMDAQEAKMLEREGKVAEARAHYARALSLLPQYATVAAHLAALSSPADAIAMLEPLTKTSDDPEIEVQLSDALRRAGRSDEAADHLKTAIARYDELLEAHPEAFADHAAAMWLGPGKDPARALPLAKQNVKLRPTAEAYDLYVAAALAARDDVEACAAGRGAAALKYSTPDLKALARVAVAKCPSGQ